MFLPKQETSFLRENGEGRAGRHFATSSYELFPAKSLAQGELGRCKHLRILLVDCPKFFGVKKNQKLARLTAIVIVLQGTL
jgi:hypothetical protein